jgi:tRNA A-37 threonylcarbamoyl transferase component Bud32
MNDLYGQKAKKYKYKYLKLKKQYIAEGGFWLFDDLVNMIIPPKQSPKQNITFNFIGKGSFGCIISPPIIFNNISNDYYKENYVAKLLSKNNFDKEIKEYENINKIDPEAKYRSKLIFEKSMEKKDIQLYLKSLISENRIIDLNQIKKSNKLTENEFNKLSSVEKLYVCINNRFLNNDDDNDYGYIISTKVGKSFKDHNLGIFNNEKIITILTNLKESIGDLIQKLYDDESIHGDIKSDNMTLDDNLNVYFIDFGLMTKYTNEKQIRNQSLNYHYPKILNIFLNYNNKMTKIELIKHFKNEYLKIQSLKYLNFKVDFSRFFESIDKKIPILEDDKEYLKDNIYKYYIEPIAKNIDINSLSLFIYELIFSFNPNNINNFNNVKQILKTLIINALYNNIDGPQELIIYLDGIINTINNTYSNQYISTQIKKRRIEKDKKYIFYYDNEYIVDSNKYNYKYNL